MKNIKKIAVAVGSILLSFALVKRNKNKDNENALNPSVLLPTLKKDYHSYTCHRIEVPAHWERLPSDYLMEYAGKISSVGSACGIGGEIQLRSEVTRINTKEIYIKENRELRTIPIPKDDFYLEACIKRFEVFADEKYHANVQVGDVILYRGVDGDNGYTNQLVVVEVMFVEDIPQKNMKIASTSFYKENLILHG